MNNLKVAIVHDWLVNYGGAERVVEAFLEIFPDADIFTLVYDKKKMSKHFPPEKIHTSKLQKLPLCTKIYTKLLKFMPSAFEEFDFSGYDLVLCSSSCCAKGVITPTVVPHIAYIHSPMRYCWDLYFDYKKSSGKLTQFFMKRWIPNLRLWDYVSSQRQNVLIANSNYIAKRIKKFWNRDAKVIYPPVNVDRLEPNNLPSEDFYCAFSRLVPYKRMDLAISACKKLGKTLVVIGDGSEREELHKLAANSKNITFLHKTSDAEIKSYLQKCKALIFCAEEDFGIIPLEAQSCGRPVIAFGKGGALETVVDGVTGVYFDKQEPDSVCAAIERFETLFANGAFDSKTIASHAQKFSRERFKKEITELIEEYVK